MAFGELRCGMLGKRLVAEFSGFSWWVAGCNPIAPKLIQIATIGAIWSNSNRTKGRILLRVMNSAMARDVDLFCNVNFESGTRTFQIESAHVRAILLSNYHESQGAFSTHPS